MNTFGMSSIAVSDIAHAIQLSVTPVFLLSGIGVLLSMLTTRLARIVDRARPMEESLKTAGKLDAQELVERLKVLAQRARMMSRAITLSTVSALLVASVVALLFLSAFVSFSLTAVVAAMFILAMACLIGSLLSFLFEVQLATVSIRIGPRDPPDPPSD